MMMMRRRRQKQGAALLRGTVSCACRKMMTRWWRSSSSSNSFGGGAGGGAGTGRHGGSPTIILAISRRRAGSHCGAETTADTSTNATRRRQGKGGETKRSDTQTNAAVVDRIRPDTTDVSVRAWSGGGIRWLVKMLRAWTRWTVMGHRCSTAQRIFDYLGEAAVFRLWGLRLLDGITALDPRAEQAAFGGRMYRLELLLGQMARGLRIGSAARWLAVTRGCTDLAVVPLHVAGCLVPVHAMPALDALDCVYRGGGCRGVVDGGDVDACFDDVGNDDNGGRAPHDDDKGVLGRRTVDVIELFEDGVR